MTKEHFKKIQADKPKPPEREFKTWIYGFVFSDNVQDWYGGIYRHTKRKQST